MFMRLASIRGRPCWAGMLTRSTCVRRRYNEGLVSDYRDWQIPLGRRFRSLKLWMVLRQMGVSGLRRHIRRGCALAQRFAQLVDDSDEFEIAAPPALGLVCFRVTSVHSCMWGGGKWAENSAVVTVKRVPVPCPCRDASDEDNEAVLTEANASGKVFMISSQLDGSCVLRFATGGALTTEKDVLQVRGCFIESCTVNLTASRADSSIVDTLRPFGSPHRSISYIVRLGTYYVRLSQLFAREALEKQAVIIAVTTVDESRNRCMLWLMSHGFWLCHKTLCDMPSILQSLCNCGPWAILNKKHEHTTHTTDTPPRASSERVNNMHVHTTTQPAMLTKQGRSTGNPYRSGKALAASTTGSNTLDLIHALGHVIHALRNLVELQHHGLHRFTMPTFHRLSNRWVSSHVITHAPTTTSPLHASPTRMISCNCAA